MLTKATPEGARDYLVPSRTHPGQFFALPQSPQIFKQLLMMSGFDRYYQIVRCFRDEDLRAERQPEFTQLDIETSFLGQEQIIQMMEELLRHVFKAVLGDRAAEAVPAPDVRGGDAALRVRQAGPAHSARARRHRRPGAQLASSRCSPARPRIRKAASSRCACRKAARRCRARRSTTCTPFVARYGAKGLAYVKVNEKAKGREGLQSPILKFLSDDAINGILSRTGAVDGDLIFFGADTAKVVNDSIGALRLKLGHDLGLVQTGWQPLWVVDFPMFEWDADAKRWGAVHHPFTSPRDPDPAALRADPANAVANAYDIVLNGSEIGGGSVRIHRQEMQSTVFDLLGISAEEAQKKFGFLLEALKYGTPPHGGIAFGLDRIVMFMAGTDSIRDVIAFPKTQTAADLMTDAPTTVSDEQLKELHIA